MTQKEQVKTLLKHLEYFEKKMRVKHMHKQVEQADIIILTGTVISAFLDNKKKLDKQDIKMVENYKLWATGFLNSLTFTNAKHTIN